MEFSSLEEKLYHLYCSSEFENIISIARKEFLNGNREIYLLTFLAYAYRAEGFKNRNKILSKISLKLINKIFREKNKV